MQRAKKVTWSILAGWSVAMWISAAAAQTDDKTLVEWRFDHGGRASRLADAAA